jgi:hypothetical protein
MSGLFDLFTAIPKKIFMKEPACCVDSEPDLEKNDVDMESDKHHAAEGGHDNIHLGQDGASNPRAVAPKRRPSKRPNPEDLFDMLLARRGQPVAHPAKISSLLLGLAGIIVHDLFRASENDEHVATKSPYLALTPLYGREQDTQDSVRTKVDGKLKTDTFAEIDIVNQPPQVGLNTASH